MKKNAKKTDTKRNPPRTTSTPLTRPDLIRAVGGYADQRSNPFPFTKS